MDLKSNTPADSEKKRPKLVKYFWFSLAALFAIFGAISGAISIGISVYAYRSDHANDAEIHRRAKVFRNDPVMNRPGYARVKDRVHGQEDEVGRLMSVSFAREFRSSAKSSAAADLYVKWVPFLERNGWTFRSFCDSSRGPSAPVLEAVRPADDQRLFLHISPNQGKDTVTATMWGGQSDGWHKYQPVKEKEAIANFPVSRLIECGALRISIPKPEAGALPAGRIGKA